MQVFLMPIRACWAVADTDNLWSAFFVKGRFMAMLAVLVVGAGLS